MSENKSNENYGTLSEAINRLIKLGYTHDFNIKDEGAGSHRSNMPLSPQDFRIDQVYRFEGNTDPDYQSVLYAISSIKHSLKGILVNGYGISSDEFSSQLIEKLETNSTQNIMENKFNDATALRPEGERVLNAPLVEMNLDEFIHLLKSESTWKNSDRNSVTIFKSETMTMVLIGLHANAELKPHATKGLISIQMLEGKIEFTAELRTAQMSKGQMLVLQENITHGVRAVTECCFLLTIVMNTK